MQTHLGLADFKILSKGVGFSFRRDGYHDKAECSATKNEQYHVHLIRKQSNDIL